MHLSGLATVTKPPTHFPMSLLQTPDIRARISLGGGGEELGGGGKGGVYERRYPACTEEPVRREGATGPERPKRMRPDGAVCYVEGKHGGLGVKRRNVQQGEQTGRPPGRPPEG